MSIIFGSTPGKAEESAALAALVAAYEAKGGKVTVLPLGHVTVSQKTKEELRAQLNMVERAAGRKGHGETAKGDKRKELRDAIAKRRYEQGKRPREKQAFGYEINIKRKGKNMDVNLCK